MTLEFTVEQKENGMLLRDFLRKRGVSAALAKGVKASDGFFRDGAPVHTDMRLSAGQRISFALPPEPPTEVLPQALPLDILYEDAHAMVLNKPAGQTVHPTRGYADGTLANAFRGRMAARGSAAVFRPVNRLDRGTSGLVLCAMNAYAAPLLAAAVQKVYYAVAERLVDGEAGAIDAPHGIPGAGTGRRAHTAAGGARHGAHTSDPCAFRVPGASAGGRRHVRRMSGAHGAPGAALRRGIVWPDGGGCGAHSGRAAARRHACAAGGVRHPGGRFRHLTPSVC